MIRTEIDEIIRKPIDQVFDRLVDIPSYPNWMPDDGLFIACRQESDGPVGRGTTYSDKTRLGTIRDEITIFDRPTRVVFHYTARPAGITMMEGWPGYTLEAEGPNTPRIHHLAKGRLYGAFKIIQPLIQIIARGERRRTVNALKESLESQS
jgi:uncharacterized protein YndB with AHSA1/START domain